MSILFGSSFLTNLQGRNIYLHVITQKLREATTPEDLGILVGLYQVTVVLLLGLIFQVIEDKEEGGSSENSSSSEERAIPGERTLLVQ